MLTQFRAPDHHFHAYYQDNSILIQCIIIGFVETYQLTSQIKILILERLDSNQDFQSLFSSLKLTFKRLLESHPQQENSSHSRWTQGALTRLKTYCEQYSRNSSHQNKHHCNLHMMTHQAWLTAFHTLELVNALTVNPYTQNAETILHLLPVKRSFNSLLNRINQVMRCFPKILHAYWNDENVMLCILRIRGELTQIYGSDFLHKRFKCPFKPKELIQFLLKRYQERGFDDLLPTIQQLFETEK